MSASKLAESFSDWLTRNAKFPRSTVLEMPEAITFAEAYAEEMALRVFEDTRERAAKIAADAIAPNRRDIAEAIRAMQPEPAIAAGATQRDSPAEPRTNAGRDPVKP